MKSDILENNEIKEINNDICSQEKAIQKTNTTKHNGIISFWKFSFALMIVLFHANAAFAIVKEKGFFHFGYIAVEFFFLVSGFLLGKSALSKKDDSDIYIYIQRQGFGKETFNFILNKIKSLFPYVLISSIIGLIIVNIYVEDITIYENIISIFDTMLIRMCGIQTYSFIGPIWYISSMLISMMILYPLIRKYKYNFVYIVAPLIVILGYGYLSHLNPCIDGITIWLKYIYKGTLRAFVDLSFGVILYAICEKMKTIDFTTFGKLVLTIIEITGFISIFCIAQFVKKMHYDFVEILILAISITIAFSEQTLELKLMNNKFVYWLEKISIPLFLVHYPINRIIVGSNFFIDKSYLFKITCSVSISLTLAIITYTLVNFLRKRNFYFDKIKKVFIKQQ